MNTDNPLPASQPSLPPDAFSPGCIMAGFWRRFFAFALDSILLGIIGSILGALFFDAFTRMGAMARIVGFLVATIYFALFDSSIGKGRSIGKRLLRLKLVDAQGEALALEEAILRFVILAVPYFLNGLPLPVSRTSEAVGVLLSLVVFGVGGTNLYLLIFNRGTRQGLHDMVVKSYVIMVESEGPVTTGLFWTKHWGLIGSTVGVAILAASIFSPWLAKRGSFPQMMQDVALVEQIEGVITAGVNETKILHSGPRENDRFLTINVLWSGAQGSENAVINQIARTILEHDHNIQRYSKMRIILTRGYDIGIASRWTSQWAAYSPDEWREQVQ